MAEAKKATFEANVKRQISNPKIQTQNHTPKEKTAIDMAKLQDLASVKKNITKSLTFAGLLLASEVVLYLLYR